MQRVTTTGEGLPYVRAHVAVKFSMDCCRPEDVAEDFESIAGFRLATCGFK